MSDYVTNCSLPEIADTIRRTALGGGRIVLLTHIKPDGDAAGSSLALGRAIHAIAPGTAAIWHGGAIPAWLPPLFGETPLNIATNANTPDDAALILVLDTGSWPQLEHVAPYLKGREQSIIVVDHHRQGDTSLATRRYVDTGAASVCQIVSELCRLVLQAPSIAALPRAIAHPLYLGNATDTGWFRHSNVTGTLLKICGELVEAGAEPSALYQLTEQQDRPQRLKLLARALESLELFENAQLAVMSLGQADFQKSGAQLAETGGFVDYPALIQSVRVVALLTEMTDARGQYMVKISLRSKSGPSSVDVNRIAQKFNGGGHIAAAGGRSTQPLVQTRTALIAEVAAALKA